MDNNLGNAPSEDAAPSFEESFESALESSGLSEATQQTAETPGATPDVPASEPEKAGDPEHVAWLKSINGYANDKGEINADLVYRQYHQQNRWAQQIAQENAELRRNLQQREVELAVRKETGKKVEPEAEPHEKTDLEIFDEMVAGKVNEKLEATVKPYLQQTERMHQRYVESECKLAAQELREHFGKVDDGKGGQTYLYDTVAPVMGQAIAQFIQQQGQEPNPQNVGAFFARLVDNGSLKSTFFNMATNLLYPQVREQLEKTRQTTKQDDLAKQKATKLPARGAPAKVLKPSTQYDSWEAAVKAAEEEVGASFG